MVARVVRQAIITDGQYDWSHFFVRLPKFLFILSVLALMGMGMMKLNDPQLLPIQKVRAQGTFINLTEQMLLKQVGDITGGYFNINVSAVQNNIESLAWVEHAYVKRVWPDTLMISVTEQKAMTVWQSKGLINSRGELFYPAKDSFPVGLPQLNGPVDSHQQLLEYYQGMSTMLAGTGLSIQQLDMDARRSVVLRFDNGLKIFLGRDANYPRLERFIRNYAKALVIEVKHIQQIDMRYTNGFTVLRK